MHHLVVVAIERRIQAFQDFPGMCPPAADDDAIRFHEVVDGGAFLQKLGIRGDIEVDIGAPGCQHRADTLPNQVGRAHGNR